eukprot:5985750-Amphidinium_carterae.1
MGGGFVSSLRSPSSSCSIYVALSWGSTEVLSSQAQWIQYLQEKMRDPLMEPAILRPHLAAA